MQTVLFKIQQHQPARKQPAEDRSHHDALQAIGWPLKATSPVPDGISPSDQAWLDLMAEHPKARPTRVIEQHRSGYIVADGPDHGFPVESLPEWQRPPGYRKGTVTIGEYT